MSSRNTAHASEKDLSALRAQVERGELEVVEKLRAHLTLSDNPELRRRLLEGVATHAEGSVVREEFERYWGPEAAAIVQDFLVAGLVSSFIRNWQTRIRASHRIVTPKIYRKPELLQRDTTDPFYVPLESVTWDPSSGFLLNIDKPPLEPAEAMWNRARVKPHGEGRFDVTVPHGTKFLRVSLEEWASKGVFTARPILFEAPRLRLLRRGAKRVQLKAPNRGVIEPAANALA